MGAEFILKDKYTVNLGMCALTSILTCRMATNKIVTVAIITVLVILIVAVVVSKFR